MKKLLLKLLTRGMDAEKRDTVNSLIQSKQFIISTWDGNGEWMRHYECQLGQAEDFGVYLIGKTQDERQQHRAVQLAQDIINNKN